MLTKYQKYMENALKEMVREMIKDQVSFSIVVNADDNWDKPLPKANISQAAFMIKLFDWSLEKSYVKDDLSGLFVQTAFGEEEYSKLFAFSDISIVLDDSGSPLFTRVFESEEIKAYSFKDLMHK